METRAFPHERLPGLELRVLPLGELLPWVESQEYALMPQVPLSRHRAQSYAHNPRALASDPVLFMLWHQGQMVAYRCALPDALPALGLRLAWISGSWTHPAHRRLGLTTRLLEPFVEAWEGRAAFTNYAPESHLAYRKSGLFVPWRPRPGLRLYLRPTLARLLPRRWPQARPLAPALAALDGLARLARAPWLAALERRLAQACPQVEHLARPDGQALEGMERWAPGSLFARSGPELDWILSHPWVLEGRLPDSGQGRYQFSSLAGSFRWHLLKLRRGGRLAAVLLAKLRDGQLDLPYAFFDAPDAPEVAAAVALLALRTRADSLLLNDERLFEPSLWPAGLAFLRRRQDQQIYLSQRLAQEAGDPGGWSVQAGDGDGAFT